MGILVLLLVLALQGLIIGALGRLAVPGPNPMSLGQTILVGIAGSFVGGLLGALLFGRRFGFLLGVLAAAGIVYVLERRRAPIQ